MKKNTLMVILSLLSFCTYGQLALEGFETSWAGTPAAPPNWTVYNQIGNITWTQAPNNSSTPSHGGVNSAFLQRENVNPGAPIPTNWLITPQFNVPAKGLLHFFSRLTFVGDNGSIYKIKIAPVTDPTVPVQNLAWVDLVPPMSEFDINPAQQQYEEKKFSIPAVYTSQQVRIAFIMEGDNADRWLIDDVEVIAQCDSPATLSANNIGLNSASLSWISPIGVNSWEVEVIPSADTPTGIGETYSGTLPFVKNGLMEKTNYKFYVRSLCSDNGKSDWIGPIEFRTFGTGENCSYPIVVPSALPYATINNTSNFADTHEGAPGSTGCGTTSTSYLNGNDVVYSYTPTANGTINITNTTGGNSGLFVYANCADIGTNCIAGALSTATAAAVIPSLAVTANTTYYIVISTNGTPQTTPYNLSIQQVPTGCAAPTALAASNFAPTSVNISWAAGGATSWQIYVQNAGGTIPLTDGQNVTQNTNLIINSTTAGVGFSQATLYEYYVRVNCTGGTKSIWSGPFVFQTTQMPATWPYTENFDGASANFSFTTGTQVNKWYTGSAVSSSFPNSLYVSSDNGLTTSYTLTSQSTVHAYRDIQIPAGMTQLGVSFDLRVGGENNFDYVRVWLAPTSFVPIAGTQITNANATQIGGNFQLTPEWSTQNVVINATTMANSTRRLIFEWRNNTALGAQPAGSIDNIVLSHATCMPPTALTVSGATSNSATISWTAPTGTPPQGYEYYYSQSNITPSNSAGGMGSVTGATTTIIPGLTSTQTYYIWVRSTCGGGTTSLWSAPATVIVPQIPSNLDFSQNFDSGTNGFSIGGSNSSNKWAVGSAVSNSAPNSLYISADNGTTNAYDVTQPTVTHVYKDVLIPADAIEINVSFDYKVAGDSNDYLRVWMAPATFNPVAGTQVTTADGTLLGASYYNVLDWTNASFDLPVTAYQGQQRRLIFEWRTNSGGGTQPSAAIDNVSIIRYACPKPSTLAAIVNPANTNITLDWTETGTATNWEVAYMPAATAAEPTTAGIPVTGNSEYTPAPGTFVAGTQYAFYVRSNCGTTTSKWSGPYLFALKPSNDECAQAMVVPTNPDKTCTNFVTGSVIGATGSPEASTCSGTKDDDVWFEFVATHTSHIITFSNVTGSVTDIWHAVYSGNNCGTMTQMYCSNPQNSLAQNLVIGQTYKIRVYTFTSTPNQNTSFQLCITTPPPAPVNDNCATAIALTVNPDLNCDAITNGTVESATASGVATTCTGSADDDVWFTFVATNVTHKIDFLNIVGQNLIFVLYSGNCGALTQLYCNQTNQTGLWANNLTVGATYTLRAYTQTSTPGQTTTFGICISTPPLAPANDNCVTPTVVNVNPTLECVEYAHGNVVSATPSTETNNCTTTGGNGYDDDIWFEFTATSTSHIIEFKNFVGKGFALVQNYTDLYHVLYTGTTCGSLTLVSCNINNNSLATGLTIGQVYKIRVFSQTTTPNQQSEFDVCITTPPAVPANDNCNTATVIPVNPDSYCNVHASGTVYGATASTQLLSPCTGTADDDVWFEFTATNTHHLIYIDKVTGTSANLYHSVYGGDCGTLTQLYCDTDTASNYNQFVVGQTYKVRVYTSGTGNQSTTFNICVRMPNLPISVSANAYTPEQLVKEVLFNTPCAAVSNVTSRSGLDFGDVPSMGYFDAPAGATFPFNYGVILTTGDVNNSEGPFSSNAGSNTQAWLGDDDLNDLILENNIFNDNGTRNATVLEFDFVPLINKFEFEFLFASAEYGAQQCGFGDAFAFILTDGNGNSENLAVIPDTDIPVSVFNIRDEQWMSNCGSNNVEYFGQYNVKQPLASAINFNGQTVPMIASADVVPGQNYHIKLVISDYSDTLYTSAVFLGGGTFNIGQLDLGVDLLVATNTALCDTESKIIDTQLDADEYDFAWYKDGVLIDGATESTYEVTETGLYGVEATNEDIDCSYQGTLRVEIYPLVNDATGNPVNMTQCDASGFHSFDITPNVDILTAAVTNPADYTVTVHLTEQDAIDGINAIDPATYAAFTNTVEDLQTLWTRTVYSVTGCFGIKPFDLVVQDLTPVYTIDPDFSICDGTSDTIDVVITDTDPNPVTYTWTKDGAPLPDTTPSITVTEAGAYTVVLDRIGCTATSTVNVVVTPIPVADTPADITVCESYVLPALSAGNTYYDAATNAAVAAGTEITQTTTFNIVASSGTTPECTSQSTFTVTVNHAPAIPAMDNVTACDSYLLPALTVGNYYTAAGDQLQEGDEIFASQTIFVHAETGTVPNCTSEISFEVIINTSPTADAPQDVDACDSYALPALSAGNSYWTGTNATGEQLPVGYLVEQSMDIFVFAQTATNPVCTDENMFRVIVTPTPSFDLGGPYRACLPSNVTITVEGDNYNENEASYQWRNSNGDPVAGGRIFTPTYFGTYTLTVTVKNCSHTESIEVFENTDPIALIITDGCEDGVYMVEVSDDNGSFDTGTTAYAWTGPGNFTSDKRSFATNVEGEYYVTITTAEGCTSEDSYIVTSTSCEIQKGISPNNDGYNDYFDLSELMVRHLGIFNRYGHEVYSKDNYKNEWTGQTNNGKELPTGTYFYMIEFTSGESKTGWIYINRQD